jgi:hypothetical protein
MYQTRLAASKHSAVSPFCEMRSILRQYAEKAWNSIRRQSKDRGDFAGDDNLDRRPRGRCRIRKPVAAVPAKRTLRGERLVGVLEA